MSEKTENAVIRVRLIGEIPAYYRSYYEVVTPEGEKPAATGKFYALTNYRSVRTWSATTGNGGDPGAPLDDGLHIEIMSGDEVISKEIISRVDENTSIGVPVVEPPDEPVKPRKGAGKKAAGTPGDTDEPVG